MFGIIVALILSWLLLWLMTGKRLDAIGWKPSKYRLHEWVTGLLLAAAVCTVYHLMVTLAAGNGWVKNPQFHTTMFLSGSWWIVKSVVFEELVFRGALLYIALQKLGVKLACLLSAIAFGIYHWFSYQAFGNPVQMTLIFFMTGIFGWMLAFAFARTGSIYLPLALHLGWNLVQILVFSNGPLGRQLFSKINDHKPEGLVSLSIFLFQVVALPLLVLLYLRYVHRKPVTAY